MTDRPPRPRASPAPYYAPDLPSEPPTNPRIKKERRRTDWKLAGVIVLSISTVFGAYRVVLSEALAQTDAGLRVIVAEQKGLDARTTTLEKRFDRFEDRVDKQLNAALDALRVPETKRPAPLEKDAGQ